MEEHALRKEVFGNTAWQGVTTSINKIGALVFTVILARFLLPEDYGAYYLAFSIALLFFTFTDLGIGTAAVTYASKAYAKKEYKKTSANFIYLYKIKFWISLGIAILLSVMAYPITNFIYDKPLLFIPLILLAVYFFIINISGAFVSVFLIIRNFKYLAIKEIVSQSGRLLFSLIVFLGFASAYYLNSLFVALIFSEIIVLITALILVKREAPFILEKSNIEVERRKILKFISYSSVALVSFSIFGHIDILMLGYFIKDNSFIGFYSSAMNLVLSAAGLFMFGNLVLLPVFSSLKEKAVEGPLNKVLRYVAIVTIPASFGLAVVGRYVIALIFGHEFVPARYPLYFLSFLIFSAVTTSILTTLFSAREKPKFVAKAVISTLLVNIVLNVILITQLSKISNLWAISGAAIATLVGRYAFMVALFYMSKKHLGVRLKVGELVRPLIASIIMAVGVHYLIQIFGDINIWNGGVVILGGITIYGMIMVLIGGINRADVDYLRFRR